MPKTKCGAHILLFKIKMLLYLCRITIKTRAKTDFSTVTFTSARRMEGFQQQPSFSLTTTYCTGRVHSEDSLIFVIDPHRSSRDQIGFLWSIRAETFHYAIYRSPGHLRLYQCCYLRQRGNQNHSAPVRNTEIGVQLKCINPSESVF